MDSTQSYDELADHYDKIFENWEASIARQAAVLARILLGDGGQAQQVCVLDCSCGIGTQCLGLAMAGFSVEGCDISPRAIQRARSEASKRGLNVQFSVANMLQLGDVGNTNFDAVICIDNSLPHLQTDDELLQAARQAHGRLKDGGLYIGSIRDYDRLVLEKPALQGPMFYSDDDRKRIVFQLWDWLDERRYRFHLYITWSTESGWQTIHFTSVYRAVLRRELREILLHAGFSRARWLMPSQSGFYQPIFVAMR